MSDAEAPEFEGRTGRQPRLSEEAVKIITDKIALGIPEYVAAGCAGFNPSTLRYWKRIGRLYLWRKENDPEHEDQDEYAGLCARLLVAVKKAADDAIAVNLAVIRQAATGYEHKKTKIVKKANGQVEETVETSKTKSWQAAAWWLERTHPEQYSRHVVSNDKDAESSPSVIRTPLAAPVDTPVDDAPAETVDNSDSAA